MKKVRIISLNMLFIFLVSVLNVGVYAGNNKHDNTLQYVTTIGANKDVWLQVFEVDQEKVEEVNLSYEMVKDESNKCLYIDGVISLDKDEYKFTASGEYEAVLLKSCGQIITCPLNGSISVGENNYDIIVGYDSTFEKEAITINIKKGYMDYVIAFGEGIFSQEILEEEKLSTSPIVCEDGIREDDSKEETTPQLSISPTNSYHFNTEAYDYSNFEDSNGSVTGGKSKIYYEDNNYILELSAKSYISKISDHLSEHSSFYLSTTLYKIDYGLDFEEGTCVGVSPTEEQDGRVVQIIDVFEDVLALFQVPTSTIGNILDNVFLSTTSRIDVDEDPFSPSVLLKASSTGGFNCDNYLLSTYYIINPNTSKQTSGEFYIDFTYKIYETIPGYGTYSYYSTVSTGDDFFVSW